jgi:hypothetical protein
MERFQRRAETKGETANYLCDPRQRPILFVWNGAGSGLEEEEVGASPGARIAPDFRSPFRRKMAWLLPDTRIGTGELGDRGVKSR